MFSVLTSILVFQLIVMLLKCSAVNFAKSVRNCSNSISIFLNGLTKYRSASGVWDVLFYFIENFIIRYISVA